MSLANTRVVICMWCIMGGSIGQYYGDHFSYNETDFETENGPEIQSNELLSREKRTLVYPDSSNLVLIFGLGTPLMVDDQSIIIGVFTKAFYALPDNATDYTEPGVYYGRSRKSRWSIYKALEAAGETMGFGGKECMLRAICEVSHVSFDSDHGLLGELVHVFLTPSSTNETLDEYGDQEYHTAERLGQHVGENCHALYPECQNSILDVFSKVSY